MRCEMLLLALCIGAVLCEIAPTRPQWPSDFSYSVLAMTQFNTLPQVGSLLFAPKVSVSHTRQTIQFGQPSNAVVDVQNAAFTLRAMDCGDISSVYLYSVFSFGSSPSYCQFLNYPGGSTSCTSIFSMFNPTALFGNATFNGMVNLPSLSMYNWSLSQDVTYYEAADTRQPIAFGAMISTCDDCGPSLQFLPFDFFDTSVPEFIAPSVCTNVTDYAQLLGGPIGEEVFDLGSAFTSRYAMKAMSRHWQW